MKREYAKLLTVLQAYALIATGVRLICTNHVRAAWQCWKDGQLGCVSTVRPCTAGQPTHAVTGHMALDGQAGLCRSTQRVP